MGDADLILIMSVNPGFGGQKFIPSSLQKIANVRALIDQTHSHALLEVDGGVKPDNAESILAAGADVLVAGSAVARAEMPSAPGLGFSGIGSLHGNS